MEEILTIANKLGGVSFATLLVIILAGSYFKMWVWWERLAEEKARGAEALAKAEKISDEWKAMVLDARDIIRKTVDLHR